MRGWITQDGITHVADGSVSGSWLAIVWGNKSNWATCLSSTSKEIWPCSHGSSRFKESKRKHTRPLSVQAPDFYNVSFAIFLWPTGNKLTPNSRGREKTPDGRGY